MPPVVPFGINSRLSFTSYKLVMRPCEIVSCRLGLLKIMWSEPLVYAGDISYQIETC